MNLNIEVNERVLEFAKKARFPGWYIDFNGSYCCIINGALCSVFVNSDTDELDFTIDTANREGIFDVNRDWVTLDKFECPIQVVCDYITEYLCELSKEGEN